MEIVTQDGAGLNTERLAETSKDLAAAARDFKKSVEQFAEAVNTAYWAAIDAAMAAAGYGAPEVEPDTEPDENPVRFIGIRKGGWRHKRRVRCGL